MSELQKDLTTFDLNRLSIFFRENNKKLHSDIKLVLSNYDKFDIKNKHLRDLREDFFCEQIKLKIEDNTSEWDTDQIEALHQYKREWEENERIIRKDIAKFQNKLQSIDKLYQGSKVSYRSHSKKCQTLKHKLEELCETKNAYENVINILTSEIQTLQMFNLGKSTKKPNITKSRMY
jgi:chromosome segregation ATPase